MRFSVLGGIAVTEGGTKLAIGGPRQVVLLGVLLANRNSPTSVDRLVDFVWYGEQAPEGAERTLASYISRLRRVIGKDRITSESGGPCLWADNTEVDFARYDGDVRELRDSLARGELEAARFALDRALQDWRGEPFGTYGSRSWAIPIVQWLGALRHEQQALEAQLLLSEGRPSEALVLLEPLIASQPLSEELRRIELVTRRHIHGPADAIRSLDRYRALVVENTGLDLSTEFEDIGLALRTGAQLTTATARPPLRGYQPVELLERTSNTERWLASAYHLDTTVELQIVNASKSNRPEFIQTFEPTAKRLARFSHPAHMPLLDHWREPGAAYLVHSAPEGVTLEDWRKQGNSAETTMAILDQLGNLLKSAHECSLTHGALSGSNLWVGDGDQLRVTDIGIADLLAGDGNRPANDERAFAVLALQLFNDISDGGSPVDDRILVLLSAATKSSAPISDLIRKLQAYLGINPLIDSTSTVAQSPFVGLAAFEEADAPSFFGREDSVDSIITLLGESQRTVTIVGPSGSGKSSLVHAGVVPAIRNQLGANGTPWFIVSMTPGEQPLASLEVALQAVATDEETFAEDEPVKALLHRVTRVPGRVLLVVDQLEELFNDRAQGYAAEFGELLSGAISDPESNLRIIMTLRSDFFDQALRLPTLAALLRTSVQPLGVMAAEDLERTITRPVALAGRWIEPGLVARLITDVGQNPAALPLLQFTLTEIWADASEFASEPPVLTMDLYDGSGGIAASVARRAEQIFDGLDQEGHLHFERSMRRLTNLDDENRPTRRRLRIADLPDGARAALDPFIDARLLTSHFDPASRAPTIELTHEALFNSWPRLRTWIESQTETIRLEQLVTKRAAEWESGQRAPDDLLRGAKLDEIRTLSAEGAIELPVAERGFIDASVAEYQKEQRSAEHRTSQVQSQNRRLRRLLVALALLLTTALIATVLAIGARAGEQNQRRAAQSANRVSEARRMSAEAVRLLGSNREAALLLATEAYQRVPSAQSLGALQDVIVGLGPFLGVLGPDRVYQQAEWLDSNTIVGMHSGGVDLFDITSSLPLRSLSFPTGSALAVDPGSGQIAVAGTSGGVLLYDHNFQLEEELETAVLVQALAFSPEGEILVAGDREGLVSVWSLNDPDPQTTMGQVSAHPEVGFEDLPPDLRPSESAAHEPLSYPIGVAAIAFAPDGRHFATAGGIYIRTFDLDSTLVAEIPVSRPLQLGGERGPGRPSSLHWKNPHTLSAVVESYLQAIDVFGETLTNERLISTQVTSGARTGFGYDSGISIEVVGLPTGVVQIVDSLDSIERDNTASTAGLKEIVVGGALQQVGQPVAIGPNQKTLAVSGEGIRLFSIDGRQLIADIVPIEDPFEFYVNSDGTIATVVDRGTTRSTLWRRTQGMKLVESVPATRRFLPDVFGPLAVSDEEKVMLLDPASGRPTGIEVTGVSAWSGAIDPMAASWLAIGFGQPGPPLLEIIDLTTGAVATTIEYFDDRDAEIVSSVAISPDGRLLAAATADGQAAVFDTNRWTLVATISEGAGQVTTLAFSPDGLLLLTAGDDGTVSIRDSTTFQPTGLELLGSTASLGNFSPWGFTSDGMYVVTALDSRLRIYELSTGQLVGEPFPGDLEVGTNVSPDGRFGTSAVGDLGLIWHLDLASWPSVACAAVGRNLSDTEWAQFGAPGEPTPTTCSDYNDDKGDREEDD